MSTSEEVAVRVEQAVDQQTGEVFDLAKPGDAVRALRAFDLAAARINQVRESARQTLIEEAQRQGTKTLRLQGETVKISGGPGMTEIDPVKLREGLLAAGCPDERVEHAIRRTVEEKVDRRVTRQLSMNPAYKAAIDAATYTYEKRYGVSLA